MLLRVASFLEISTDRLLQATFPELLANEVADTARFSRVEAKIHAHRGRESRPRRTA